MASPYSIIINPKFSEKDWIVQMEHNLELDLDAVVAQTPLCIYHVPESLRISKRDAYTPQFLALGPYHHWKPELYQAETHKLAAAKRAQREFHLPADFRDFVAGISRLVPGIRACYDRHLQMTDQALAWIIAVDALFLLHLIYADSRDDNSNPLFFDYPSSSRKSLLRDAVMLENQIPNFVLVEILTNFSDSGSRGLLGSVSVDFCKKVSPLGLSDPDPEDVKGRHLLDLLYHLILHHNNKPPAAKQGTAEVSEEFQANGNGNGNGNGATIGDFPKTDAGPGFLTRVLGFYSAWLRRVTEEETAGLIPTATQLRNAGVKFGVAKQGIRSISFNKETKTLTLPAFNWKPDCDVVMRNLVAYEAVARPENSPVICRYADLMNSICRTAEDVKLLQQEELIIISGGGGSDAVLEVFGGGRGMGTAIGGGGKRTVLDGGIEAVNEFYAGNRKLEVWKLATRLGKRVWEVATFLAALFLLLFFFFHVVIDIFRYPPGSPGNVTAAAAGVAKMLFPPSSLAPPASSASAASL
ncbi:unnamed protein product [Linum tenue]|uniref:Phosphoglycerate kinase n=1 Tax=Linum tenue TaxID=586396 RepID=A0AAV0GVV1_9ROSI|nr:unnamed protein product [Linum tenue]